MLGVLYITLKIKRFRYEGGVITNNKNIKDIDLYDDNYYFSGKIKNLTFQSQIKEDIYEAGKVKITYIDDFNNKEYNTEGNYMFFQINLN